MEHQFRYEISVLSNLTKEEWLIIFDKAKEHKTLKYELEQGGFLFAVNNYLFLIDAELYIDKYRLNRIQSLFEWVYEETNITKEICKKLNVMQKAIHNEHDKLNNQ